MALKDITITTTKYKVVSGDTFSEIAERCIEVDMPGYKGLSIYNEGINKLKSFNPDIENINYISVGQTIILQGTPAKKTTNNTQRVKITNIGLQSGTDRTVFATWSWNRTHTDHFEVQWRYNTEDNINNGFSGETNTTNEKISVYSGAPENSTCVSVRVKPVSKTYKSGNKEVSYWTADWSTLWSDTSTYDFSDNPPLTPGKPSNITISSKHKMTIKLVDLSLNANKIQFAIEKDGSLYKTSNLIDIKSNDTAEYSTTVATGAQYRVQCRSYRAGLWSDWSQWSDYIQSDPAVTAGIHSIYAIRELSDQENQFVVRLQWFAVSKADNYIIQYTTKESYFDSNPNEVTNFDLQGDADNPVTVDYAEISGLEGGKTYFFRVAAVTNTKQGAWSGIEAIVLGEKPTAPTTWSSTTSAIVGEPLTLYWLHNSLDGSSQTFADLEFTTIGMVNKWNEEKQVFEPTYVEETVTIPFDKSNLPEERDKVSSYEIDTAQYTEGVKIKWRVKTAGIMIDAETGNPIYSDWSVLREIAVYAQPTMEFTATNYEDEPVSELTALPIHISAIAGPISQKPIGYHLSVVADNNYSTIDSVGNTKIIVKGTSIYSKYFDNITGNSLNVTLSAGDLSLSNNEKYTIKCVVCMDSGLTTEESISFTVAWAEVEEMWPNAEIIYDSDTYTTAIKPYVKNIEYGYDSNGNFIETGERLIDNVTLTVYRREFDGTFTELDTVHNTDETYITDPHPSLDYARYRIVAVSDTTGAVSYYDMPGYRIGEISAILQWDEEWSNFNLDNEDALKDRYWSGSLLKLTYNIDISDQHDKEVELINYIGREHPVSYYGTQIGHTATWNMEIEKDDEETLYTLRRLARWMGNVYVREPSGSSYWASVKVSFSQTHCELTIPVTLEITRVEGGV